MTGSAGPTVATLGLFGVYWLTSRRDRRLERERRAYEEELRGEAAINVAVTRVLSAAVNQPRDLVWAPLGAPRQTLELMDACVLLAGVLELRHPVVAIWVMERFSVLNQARNAHWRRLFILGIRRRSAKKWGDKIGILIGGLVAWHFAEKPDSDFAD